MHAGSPRRERFFAALGSHPRPMLLVDGGGLVAANDAACVFLGFSEPSLLEVGLAAVTEHAPDWQVRLRPLLEGTEMATAWVDLVRGSDGTRGAHVRATAVQASDAGGPDGFVAVVEIDVSIDDPARIEEARGARQRYERLVDFAQEGIWEVDTAGRTVFANFRMAEILGCQVGDLLGRSMFEFFDPELADLVEAQFAVIKEGRTDRFDARCRRADGTSVWLMASAIPLFDEEGTWTGAAATAVDVTDRREQEMALRRAEELLRRTFDGAPIGMALVGVDGTWQRVNDAACRMLGRDRSELMTLTFQDLTHPEDLDLDLTLLGETLAGERSGYAIDKRYLRPDGEVVWATLTVALVRDDRGDPLFFVSQFEDVTARTRAQAEADQARLRTQRVLDRAAVAMAIVEADGTFSECNQQFLNVFRGSRDGMALLKARWFAEGAASRSLTARREGHIEGQVELPDGRVVRVLATSIDDDPDGAWIIQAIDVTRDRLERHRLAQLADRDPLTGLANRRGLVHAVEQLDPSTPLAVLFLDLDGFKQVNDTLGHDEGDRVLVRVADSISSQVREGDLVARLGGDEFAVLLVDADQAQATLIAERVVRGIEGARIGDGLVTASVGVVRGTVAELAELLDRADRAMLEAKRGGKNRVEVASGEQRAR